MRRMASGALALVWCLALVGRAAGSPGGAPLGSCDDLMPRHGDKLGQESDPPYQLLPSKGQGRIRLIVGSPEGTGYEGFIIVARDVDTGELVGEFNNLPEGDARHLECTTGLKNAVTHVQPEKKHNLEIDWEAPPDYEGTIIFNSTICKTWDVFWVGVESPRISVSKRSIDILSTPPSITFSRQTTPPYFSPTPDSLDDAVPDPFYDGCGSVKTCFGAKIDKTSGCVEAKDCDTVVSVLVEGERYVFEMQSKDSKYVAVALSDDDKMGDDSVVECVSNGDRVKIHMSWNDGKKNRRINDWPSDYVKLLGGSVKDGVITCLFERNKVTQVEGRKFDLVAKPYHLLVASGSSATNGGVGYHDVARAGTAEPTMLSVVSNLRESSDLLVKIHGALMLVSWLGTAGVGMLLARYYRQTWVNSQCCGKDQWFAWHRMFMLLTWVMSLGSAVLIFVEVGGWVQDEKSRYHAYFGVATNLLCFVQPFMAAMRPHPGASKRALFNWAHWLVGNAAHICAIIAIFFVVQIEKAKLPTWLDWVLVAYVVFHVLTHVFLTFAGCASDKQGGQRVNSFPMKDVHARNSMTHQDTKRDAPHSGLRKLVFAIYFIVVALLVAALVLIAIFAPIGETWNSLTDSFKSY